MSAPEGPDDLVTTEGVDEGSAAAGSEGLPAGAGAGAGAHGCDDGVLGPAATPPAAATFAARTAAPVPPSAAPAGPGQQLAEGEG